MLEVIAWTLAGTAGAAVLTGGVLAGVRIRRAVRAARARRAVAPPAPVIHDHARGVRPAARQTSPPGPARARPAPAATGHGVAAARVVGGDPPADRG